VKTDLVVVQETLGIRSVWSRCPAYLQSSSTSRLTTLPLAPSTEQDRPHLENGGDFSNEEESDGKGREGKRSSSRPSTPADESRGSYYLSCVYTCEAALLRFCRDGLRVGSP
jgi:hypothetical protein